MSNPEYRAVIAKYDQQLMETRLAARAQLDLRAGREIKEPEWLNPPRPWFRGYLHPGWENGFRWLGRKINRFPVDLCVWFLTVSFAASMNIWGLINSQTLGLAVMGSGVMFFVARFIAKMGGK